MASSVSAASKTCNGAASATPIYFLRTRTRVEREALPPKPEVLERLLLAKSFLDRIRFQPVAIHDRYTLASHIIASHDAAELSIAAICDQRGALPANRGNVYLMEYFDPLEKAVGTAIHAKDYFRNLNQTRNGLKHHGLFPD